MNLENFNWEFLKMRLIIIAIMYIVVIVASLLDLWSGIRKAKRNKRFVSSSGMRKTVDKLVKYFNFGLAFTLIDAVLIFVQQIALPYASMFYALIVCIVEIKSIYENSKKNDKKDIKNALDILKTVIKNKDDLGQILEEFTNKDKNTEE